MEDKIFSIIENQDLISLKRFIKENKNFDFTLTNDNGETLLHVLSQKKSKDSLVIAMILLDLNISPNSVDKNFNTCIEIAEINNKIIYGLLKSYNEIQKIN